MKKHEKVQRNHNDKCVSFCCLIGVLEHLSRVSCCQEIMVPCILFSYNDYWNVKTFQSLNEVADPKESD